MDERFKELSLKLSRDIAKLCENFMDVYLIDDDKMIDVLSMTLTAHLTSLSATLIYFSRGSDKCTKWSEDLIKSLINLVEKNENIQKITFNTKES